MFASRKSTRTLFTCTHAIYTGPANLNAYFAKLIPPSLITPPAPKRKTEPSLHLRGLEVPFDSDNYVRRGLPEPCE